jgi:hypothetical protein
LGIFLVFLKEPCGIDDDDPQGVAECAMGGSTAENQSIHPNYHPIQVAIQCPRHHIVDDATSAVGCVWFFGDPNFEFFVP